MEGQAINKEYTLQTKRLHIRRFRPDDWESLHAYLSDEEVVKYEPYPPFNEQQCREFSAYMAKHKDFWAVCLGQGEEQIGQIYLAEKQQNCWELGYVFHRQFQRKGYATEACEALLDYAFSEKAAHRISAECNPENERSWKLLERLRFCREAHLRQNVYFNKDENDNPLWLDTYMYGLLQEDLK